MSIKYFLNSFYQWDALSVLMIGLVAYVGICVVSFASRYMKGDRKYPLFFIYVILLMLAVAQMVTTDHLGIFFMAIFLSHILLVRLMVHKSNWRAAYASGMLAAKNYLIGLSCMGASFLLIYFATGETSISAITKGIDKSNTMLIALSLLLIAAMSQSAIWPFHKWLLSSLNSPTPVSAMMHAGIINSGGFLLVRFAPLYSKYPSLLTIIFIIGLISAFLGILWKLIQSDVKRMLACSTMGQMGFMFVQCGLGLFPLAVAHLIWHGLFKSYLFLSSGSSAQEQRFNLGYPPKILNFVIAFLSGLLGSVVFAYTSQKSWFSADATLVLLVLALIGGIQLSLSLLKDVNFRSFLIASIFTIGAGFVYGVSVHLISDAMNSMGLIYQIPLNAVHIIGIIVLVVSWLSILFFGSTIQRKTVPQWLAKIYVISLNSSQPSPKTITANRNYYQY